MLDYNHLGCSQACLSDFYIREFRRCTEWSNENCTHVSPGRLLTTKTQHLKTPGHSNTTGIKEPMVNVRYQSHFKSNYLCYICSKTKFQRTHS